MRFLGGVGLVAVLLLEGCAAVPYEDADEAGSGAGAARVSESYPSRVSACLAAEARAMDRAESTAAMRAALVAKSTCLENATRAGLATVERRTGSLAEVVADFRANGKGTTALCDVLFGGKDSLDESGLAREVACPAGRAESLAKLLVSHGGFAGAPAPDVTSTPEALRTRLSVVFEETAPNDISRDREAFRRELTASVEGALSASDGLCDAIADGDARACKEHGAGLLLRELSEVREVIGY